MQRRLRAESNIDWEGRVLSAATLLHQGKTFISTCMETDRYRHFVLRPDFGLAPPRTPPVEMGVHNTDDGVLRIVHRTDGINAITLTRTSGNNIVQALEPDLARALLSVNGIRRLTYYYAEADPWSVRVYGGPLWGLVIGRIPADVQQITPPAGWSLGIEVTDDPRFDDAALASLDEPKAYALVREFGAPQVNL